MIILRFSYLLREGLIIYDETSYYPTPILIFFDVFTPREIKDPKGA
jgi:hypothetical protein